MTGDFVTSSNFMKKMDTNFEVFFQRRAYTEKNFTLYL
jgi:hypothetical protein